MMRNQNHRGGAATRTIVAVGAAMAAVAGLSAAPVHAAEPGPWIAMVYSTSPTAILGGGTGLTQGEAVASAMVGCRDVNGGTACQTVGVADADAGIPCLAVAVGATPDQWGVGSGSSTAEAEAEALSLVPNGQIWGSGCAVATAPAEVEKRINVSWQEFVGGIRATVSMSGNKGQVGCTYSTQGLENFDRRFTLFDEAPTDVTISPAVPLLRVWPVTISCDNGVVLETERFY